MRSLVLVCLGLLAMASATPMMDLENQFVTMGLKDKQLLIFKLVNNVKQPLMYKDLEEMGITYKLEENIDKYTKSEVVKEFVNYYKVGMLPRGEIFTLHIDRQLEEVVRIFHLLYYAKDFVTFIKTACWLRLHVNEGMFVYALNVACRHRLDCKDIVLPAPYEVYPYYFVRADVIQKAYLLKMQRGLIDQKLCEFYGIKKSDKDVYIIDENIYDTRVYLNREDRLRYFTEDIDLNTYYYYFHIDFPFWMRDDMMDKKTRRWELTLYLYQQILARYYLERLSNGLGEIPNLSFNKPIKTGYWPWLSLHNGVQLPVRTNYYDLLRERNIEVLRLCETYEMMIKDAILKGYVEMNGIRLELTNFEDIETLGQLIYGKIDRKDVDKYKVEAYRYLLIVMKAVLGLNTFKSDKYFVVPTVLDSYQTALRDPVFYQLQKRIIHFVHLFKTRLPMYTRDDLLFPGVKIENVVVDKLVTFFDDYLMDMTNALTFPDDELKRGMNDMTVLVRKRRLNNKPFRIAMDIISDKSVDAMFKFFLGPKRDHMGKVIDFDRNRLNFVEIDSFIRKLETGKNTFIRNSLDMHNTIRDRCFSRDLFKKVETLTYMSDLLRKDLIYNNTGFNNRLILPKGRVGGFDLMLYVIVYPLRLREDVDITKLDMLDESTCKSCRDCRECRFSALLDKMPLGFPLDRRIDVTRFMTPNMKFVDVVVFHKETVCDMKTRWENYVLRDYRLLDSKIMTSDRYFTETEVDNTRYMNKDRLLDNM